MNMPGFVADASLYRPGMHYRFATKWASAVRSSGVVFPARPICGECFCDTTDFGVPGSCTKFCFDPPTGDNFPVPCRDSECNPPCDVPICGPCTRKAS